MDINGIEESLTEGKVARDQCLPEISEKRVLPISHFKPKIPARILLDPETFCKTFPYHILFNDDLVIMHSGSKLQQFCPLINDEGATLKDILVLDHPEIELTSENIFLFLNMIFMATLKKEAMAPNMPVISLRGNAWLDSFYVN